MNKLNPIQQSEYIESNFREYIKDTFDFKDKAYQKQFENELNNQVLYKGPYLNISLPFESSKSLNDLIEEGKASALFRKFGNIDVNRKLYYHQEISFEKIMNERNVVITTGTGSGKTESFLYPVINSILKEIENGDNPSGVRAILLYPMNALVNDQIDRVRKLLSDFPEIRYGFYTGDTPQEETPSMRKELEKLNNCVIPENEVLSRDEIRNNPPHLLFTNYSMLEYLLIRPNDFKIFSKEYLKNWRYIIMDEAHTYNGALGIEVSLLLRRITGLADKKPNFILTSATLGEQGKDENDIIDFAKELTSSEYSISDIIFSKRKKINYQNIEYKINPEEYIQIEECVENLESLKEKCKKYYDYNGSDIKELLYELLIRDKNIYDLYEELKDESKQFKNVFNYMMQYSFSKPEQLVSLISLINKARKEKRMIYDIKYHTFIKTLSGAYITVAPEKKLTLKPTSQINNLKTFEFGTCRYCNAPYILGKIFNNYFAQNTDVDIYENYGDNENISVDYFLLPESLKSEEIDMDNCEKYKLCGNCGYVYQSEDLNAQTCECEESYKIDVLKVKTVERKNNISSCPCCYRTSKNGIVRTVNLGKDEATAILAQILYGSLEKKNEQEKKISDSKTLSFSIGDSKEKSIKNDEKSAKQFLAFSDSRQQASFFAEFFEYNHNRFLRKRLIWEIIKNNNYEEIKLEKLVANLERLIEKNDVFPDSQLSNSKQAWITAMYELLKIDGNYSGEGLGLFYFKPNIDNVMDMISEENVNDNFGKYHITKEDLKKIIYVVFDVFRTSSAINYTNSGLIQDEKKEYLGYRRFESAIKLKKNKSIKRDGVNIDGNIRSFIPVNNSNSSNVKYIKKVANCSTEEANEILEALFNTIGIQAKLFELYDSIEDETYRINAEKYVIDNYRNSKYFKCSKCERYTPYNVHNVCVNGECDGTLYECDPDVELSSNYYRKNYMDKKIERMVIKEHTAQIEKKQAKEYQNKFKHKQINILSCSTTFEMGIDVGDLETVFMRNVPPTPANYVQRAGRAGRSDDSSAFVLTFCGTSSHDYTYFEEPKKMISGKICPPKFKITNQKIIMRHLIAASLGFFFRKYPAYYESIEKLVLEGGIEKFKEYLENKPEELNIYINEKLLSKEIYETYSDFKWLLLLEKSTDYISNFENTIKDILNDFNSEMEKAKSNSEFATAEYFKGQIAKIKKENTIQLLTKYNVIPKYGFPVDVVELEIYRNGIKSNDYKLSRDLSIAISEYAPESEIIVDKEKYTSRYIKLIRNKELTRNYFVTCPICKRQNVDEVPGRLSVCRYCNSVIEERTNDYFIEPVFGFRTGMNKESTSKKPVKTYAGEVEYLGGGEKDESVLYLGKDNYVIIETSTNDELLVTNTNPFYMCNTCGYTKIIKNRGSQIEVDEEHYSFNGLKCFNSNLKKIALGHKFKTDVAKITVYTSMERNEALSLLYAILEGISIEYNIERKDIDGVVALNDSGVYDFVIFDNVPGGAGHTKRLLEKEKVIEMFKRAKEKVSQECCDENTSCYNCLRNYNNQRIHRKLKRIYAKNILEDIINNITNE